MIDLVKTFVSRKPIIGMIHLAGDTVDQKIWRARDEIGIYRDNGVDGIIVEDYHGDKHDVHACLKEIELHKEILGNMRLGINLLYNPYSSFMFANATGADVSFVQFDNVNSPPLDYSRYNLARNSFDKRPPVLGGVRFKYQPETGRSLEDDLSEAMSRCDIIVTTGKGTGIETPLQKLMDFKKIMGAFPLFVGAGLNANNAYEQLSVVDGAIVGSYFKREGYTANSVDLKRVQEIIKIRNSLLKA